MSFKSEQTIKSNSQYPKLMDTSTSPPSNTKLGNWGATVLDLDITKELVLLEMALMPHELHQRQICAKSLFRNAETDNLSIGLQSWAVFKYIVFKYCI